MSTIPKLFEAEGTVDPDYTGKQLSTEAIAAGLHRRWVGGHWDDQGERQLAFMRAQGLMPGSRLLDVGCGSFRAGRYFTNYLNPGNYYGIDANASVMQGGYDVELSQEQRSRLPIQNLLATDRFNTDFGTQFTFALAQSVFTHINLNLIRLCLFRVKNVLTDDGRFYATFFEAPPSRPLDAVHKTKNGKPKFQERNCFWYYKSDLKWAAGCVGLQMTYIGDWGHPANQKMVFFSKSGTDRSFWGRLRRVVRPQSDF